MQLLDYHTDVLYHVGNGQWKHQTTEQYKRHLGQGDVLS